MERKKDWILLKKRKKTNYKYFFKKKKKGQTFSKGNLKNLGNKTNELKKNAKVKKKIYDIKKRKRQILKTF